MKFPLITTIFVGLVRAYQMVLSPVFAFFGVRCRFQPNCSAYAIGAFKKYGPWRGMTKTGGRLLRCHPLHPGGFDPP